jgi:broad specificity phosphatase PhoE
MLSDEGRTRAAVLAEYLHPYHPQRVITSIEPKAAETGKIIAPKLQIPFSTTPNLHEHERSHVPFLGREWFEAQVRELFLSPNRLIFGDETADQTHYRFASAIDNLLSQYPSQNIAVVTHGTVLTLYVSRLTKREPFSFWKHLGLPAFVVLSLPDRQLINVVNEIEGA